MITNEKGTRNIEFHCDGCSEAFDTETNDFQSALAKVKEDGWTIQKDEKIGWLHWCPICTDK